MKLMGIDYGIKRIGVAISDPMGITAMPSEVIELASESKAIERIQAIIIEKKVEKIVVGFPYNMDGSDGFLAEKVRNFSKRIKDISGIQVEFFDERLTTMQADRMLTEEADMSREKRKGVRDKIAAALLLQAYIDSHGQ